MDDALTRLFHNLVGRLHGPMQFRFFLQPTMAAIWAIKDGLKDARNGSHLYFWALFTETGHRKELLKSGWKSVRNTFILGLVMDTIYQVWQLKAFYLAEAIVVATVLAVIPYLLIRGPVNFWTRPRFTKTQPLATKPGIPTTTVPAEPSAGAGGPKSAA